MADIKSLTRREGEILKHIANGSTNKEIAIILNIGEQTVKNHICSLMCKLGAKNRTHAVVIYSQKQSRSPTLKQLFTEKIRSIFCKE